MTNIESLELIEELYTKEAYNYINEYYPNQFKDDTESLGFVWKLLYAAHDLYKEAILLGQSDLDALSSAKSIFTSKTIQP